MTFRNKGRVISKDVFKTSAQTLEKLQPNSYLHGFRRTMSAAHWKLDAVFRGKTAPQESAYFVPYVLYEVFLKYMISK